MVKRFKLRLFVKLISPWNRYSSSIIFIEVNMKYVWYLSQLHSGNRSSWTMLNTFINYHKNVLNYVYIKKKLFWTSNIFMLQKNCLHTVLNFQKLQWKKIFCLGRSRKFNFLATYCNLMLFSILPSIFIVCYSVTIINLPPYRTPFQLLWKNTLPKS